jgi:putative nucleotidyltransferase with HDIG domain
MVVSDTKINPVAGGLAYLPPAFELVPRLLLLLDDPEADPESLAELIRVDAGLTADVLRIANTAYFGRSERSETLQHAILRLGLNEVYRIVMKVVTSPVLAISHDPALAKLGLWTHSLAVAVAAEVIARRVQEDTQVAFTTGLLHDLGKTVLAQKYGSDYTALIDRCTAEGQPVWKAEHSAFRNDHAHIGAGLLKHWNFPDKIVIGITCHHQPLRCARPYRNLAALINVANTVAYRIGQGYGCPVETANPDPASIYSIGLGNQDLEGVEEETIHALRREREAFQ